MCPPTCETLAILLSDAMKFGKSYSDVLANPTFPDEWRDGAIEYNRLKKLLNNVMAELDSMGLRPDVVSELLHGGAVESTSGQAPTDAPDARATPSALLQNADGDRPGTSREGTSAASAWLETLPHDHRYRTSRRSRHARSRSSDACGVVLKSAENSPNTFVLQSTSDARSLKSSPRHRSLSEMHAKFNAEEIEAGMLPPLMLPSGVDSPPVGHQPRTPHVPGLTPLPPPHTPSVASEHDWNASQWLDVRIPKVFPDDDATEASEDSDNGSNPDPHWVESNSGRRAWAEYKVLGRTLDIHPQLVVHVESPDTLSTHASPSTSSPDTPSGGVPSGSSPATTPREGRMPHMSLRDLDLGPAAQEIPTISTPNVRLAQSKSRSRPPSTPGFHQRRIVIPLVADERFFESLAKALRKLLQLHLLQQNALVRHVDTLSNTITMVASPQYSPKDMYLWRDIFALWIEHDIFEGSREKDRGELSVAVSERRLRHFMTELEKRGFLAPHRSLVVNGRKLPTKLDAWEVDGYAQTNPLTDPRSIGALEHFLRLNVALVSLKRFQRLNIETVRKILKKHEKKTALSAHQSLARMVAHMNPNGVAQAASSDTLLPSIDWGTVSDTDILHSLSSLVPLGVSTSSQLSLPRILASMLTTSLLPVLPSVDDYGCMVCTAIAWQPIRLRCQHLFCIRCLVKLQKQGNHNCPLCRSVDAVKDADENNLDHEMADYLRKWFPQEIEEKTRENKSDRLVEERKELELTQKKRFPRFRRRTSSEENTQDCIIM